ncbi:MAG: SDR family NAD(P)-dependent oxidoreductase [Betaproteobacteria bacterium]|nr:SDR family NAD(P)-dependent oxidoreductase [Betaproteobacteria bacterium]
MTQTKTILLIGARSGIGLEMARILASQKYRLILVIRVNDRLEEIAPELREKKLAQTS